MTRLESIRNNTFLLGLDMNRATKEQKIQWLCQMIDNETDKPEDEIDFALIDECSAYLHELSDKAAEATKEQKRRILQQIKAHHNQTAKGPAKVLRPSWKTPRKILAIAIIAALILFSTLTVIAKVNGYSNAWEYVTENLQKIIGMDAGAKMNEGNITLVKGGESITYSSIEELLENEGYDIMYPSELPEKVSITQISYQIVNEKQVLYCIQFSDPMVSVVISTKPDFSQEYLEQHEKLEHSLLQAYLVKKTNGYYQIIGYDGKYQYAIYGNDYDLLIKVLNSLKGTEK